MKPEELIKQIEEKLNSVDINPELVNYGIVETVGDGIVKATGDYTVTNMIVKIMKDLRESL